jgi:hypothetical protein
MTARPARFATFAKPRPSGFVPTRPKKKIRKSLPCSRLRFASQGPRAAAAFRPDVIPLNPALHARSLTAPTALIERGYKGSRLVVRATAKPGLVVAAHRDLSRAPRLKRTNEYGRGQRRSDEHELPKQHPLDRSKSAKQCDQKRNRQDRRILVRPLSDKPSRLLHLGSKRGRAVSVPSVNRRARIRELVHASTVGSALATQTAVQRR